MTARLQFAVEDPGANDIVTLLEHHLRMARASSPPCQAHALDLSGLRHRAITFVTAREAGALRAIGALRELDARHGELKSMHTAEAARGRGVGMAMLQHLLAMAEARGMQRVSLETGNSAYFAAARRIYERAGFRACAPFADYAANSFSVCMTLQLPSPRAT